MPSHVQVNISMNFIFETQYFLIEFNIAKEKKSLSYFELSSPLFIKKIINPHSPKDALRKV